MVSEPAESEHVKVLVLPPRAPNTALVSGELCEVRSLPPQLLEHTSENPSASAKPDDEGGVVLDREEE